LELESIKICLLAFVLKSASANTFSTFVLVPVVLLTRVAVTPLVVCLLVNIPYGFSSALAETSKVLSPKSIIYFPLAYSILYRDSSEF